jgi:hypothetical protein
VSVIRTENLTKHYGCIEALRDVDELAKRVANKDAAKK